MSQPIFCFSLYFSISLNNVTMSFKKIFFRSLLFFSLCLFSSSAIAQVEVSLSPSVGAAYTPTETLRIKLPDDLDIQVLSLLGVELDGIDITAFLSLVNNEFIYEPVEPMAPGAHVLKLAEIKDDGTLKELVKWDFKVASSAGQGVRATTAPPSESEISEAEGWLRGASISADTLTEGSYRVADDNLPPGQPDGGIISGSGDIHTHMEGKSWSLNSNTNYLVQTDQDLRQTDNEVDIGEYKITSEYNGDTLSGDINLGHHDIGMQSYLMTSFYRRGLSARLGTIDGRVEARAFAFRSQSVTGTRDFTGLTNESDRVKGVTTSFQPFSNDLHALRITGIYLDGEGGDNGIGVAGGQPNQEGSGWAAIIDKGFWEGRLTFRGEYANTQFDTDTTNSTELDENDSDAYSMGMEIKPFKDLILNNNYVDFTIGAKYERVDTFFASLANQGMAVDRNAYHAYSNLYMGSFSADVQYVEQTNNVDDLDNVPTDRHRNLTANAAYNFDAQTGSFSWLGTPYISFTGFVSDNNRDNTPNGYMGDFTDNDTYSATVNFGTTYDSWYWAISHTLAEYIDHANVTGDTVNNLTGVNGGWTVNDRLTLNGGFQFGSLKDNGAGTTTYNANVQFGASAIFIPEILLGRFDYNLNLMTGNGDTPYRNLINGEIEWNIFAHRTNRPGISLAVRGSMEDNRNGISTEIPDGTNYQVFTVLRFRAPLAWTR